ncbi:LOG family protein [Klebsiella pneumoniae]|uniref:AMP nucleosidase n=1 Tax=Klebsiella pneumoniae TaxID=573 RepID=A0A7X1HUT2_KLEPN|nr:LOG family protein [Klebsiella pneumoniae]
MALPGGFGTSEELFQVISWARLNLHQKPIGLLNTNNFFDELLCFLDKVVDRGFLSQSTRRILIFAPTAVDLIDKLQAFVYKLEPEVTSD